MTQDVTLEESPNTESFYDTQMWTPERRVIQREKPVKRSANQAVDNVYEMIGGDQRFAQWAHDNPDVFYTKIYNRRMVQESNSVVSGEIRILPALARSPLDGEYEDVTDDPRDPSPVQPSPSLSGFPRAEQAIQRDGGAQASG